jgi:hypothetical protein
VSLTHGVADDLVTGRSRMGLGVGGISRKGYSSMVEWRYEGEISN